MSQLVEKSSLSHIYDWRLQELPGRNIPWKIVLKCKKFCETLRQKFLKFTFLKYFILRKINYKIQLEDSIILLSLPRYIFDYY